MRAIRLTIFLLFITGTFANAQERKVHTVETGQTLYSISRLLEVTVAELQAWNDLQDNAISIGQELVYYVESERDTVQENQTPDPEPEPEISLINFSAPQENAFYLVKSGDNLTTIARAHNMTIEQLRALNGLEGDLLRIGQRLTVNKVEDSVAPSAAEFSEESSPQGVFAVYTVKSGERKDELLARFQMNETELQELNPGINIDRLTPEQRITVLLPPSRSFDNPYLNKADLQDLGTVGVSSYSDNEFGNSTTNGELYNPEEFTAAHSNIALGSIIFIENPDSGQGIYVRINDRITENGLKLSTAAYRILDLGNSQNPRVIIYTGS
ncbi:MAG: LysM peptidoglycan-binding domain-containing protein [Balneolales bacterium]|nr:LysM peptidoglycan-binding domain-containing protein [Balneolales bacterium]